MNAARISSFVPTRTIVLVGMMGSGKSSIGRKLAARLALPFVDADNEVEAAAGMTISRLIHDYGEAEFRQLERRVMARLLAQPMHVLSTGGGAILHKATRDLIRSNAVSLWLDADIEVLLERTSRHDNRPLLQNGDPRQILSTLLAERAPLYATADITVKSGDRPVEETVENVIEALRLFSLSKVTS